MSQWVPLHLHSQYSILNATPSIGALVKQAKQYQLTHLALTDSCNLFGVIDFYKKCQEENITPIIGLEMMISPGAHTEKKKQFGIAPGYPVVLLAKDNKGYQNLCKISSIGSIEGFYYTPRVDKETLKKYSEGLICLSGPFRGKVASLLSEGQKDEAKQELLWLKDVFHEDFYFQMERHRMQERDIDAHQMRQESWLMREYETFIEKQEKVIQEGTCLAKELSIPLVATNDIQYLKREEWKIHEILMNIQSGEPCEIYEIDHMGNRKGKIRNPKRRVLFSHEYFFKSPDEMGRIFSDYPEAIANTQHIARQCHVTFDFSKKFYPVFMPPSLEGKTVSDKERQKEAENYLYELAIEGIKKRYTQDKLDKIAQIYPDKDPIDVVNERFEYEFNIITSKEMCDYILIVYDFIAWAKAHHIPVGPGRGSGAGSIILYLIGITDIEPLRFHLFFERFINPERVSYPDIDVDICMERRSEVIDYTLSKYGRDKVAQIITFGTMKAKMAIKDIGRMLSIPLAKVNTIAKLVPDDLSMTLKKALDGDPDFRRLYEEDHDAQRVIDYALQCEGTIRNTGVHAAGLIICGNSLTDHIPVCMSKDSDLITTQFAMKPVETVGMLKIDFLGLKTLTSIQKTVDAIEHSQGVKIDWVNLPLNDRATFDLLNQGKTSGVFQLESAGMQELAKQLHIDKFEEIIAVGALYRPGPMEMIPSFCRRKHGQEEIENDHPWMKDILEETYGIIVYQEQVMQIAQKLAGYSLGEGDVLRRAMGKKEHAVMKKEGVKFCHGAQQKGLDDTLAMQIFEKVEKFASYGFNKSHATAYGYLSYVTAFLKANYPKEWLAALMTCDIVDLTKIAKHIREATAMHIAILPPDVNDSKKEFVATDEGIRFALSAIKGIGDGVVETIVEERNQSGIFTSLTQFISRLDPKKVGRKHIECLIDAGAFDFTKKSRAHLQAILLHQYDAIVNLQKEKAKGIFDLFSGDSTQSVTDETPVEYHEAAKLTLLYKEKELLSFYLTGHPLSECQEEIGKIGAKEILPETKEQVVAVKAAFIIESVTTKISQKNGRKFAIANISDGVHNFEIIFWADLFERFSHLLVDNQLVVGVLIVDQRQNPPKIQVKDLHDLTQVSEAAKHSIDEAFKQAVQQAKQDAQRPVKIFRRSKEQEDSNMKQDKESIIISLNIEDLTLKKILQLKTILRRYPGVYPVDIEVMENAKKIASIEIDGSIGVERAELLFKDLSLIGHSAKAVRT